MAGSCSVTTRSGVAVGSGAFLPGTEEKTLFFFFFPRRKGTEKGRSKGGSSRSAPAGSVSAFLLEAPVDILFPLMSQATQKAI